MTAWATLAFTTLGGGVVGSIVTTYASQSRERRRARADAREAIRKADRLATDPPRTVHNDFIAALDNLETAAMLAGLPRALTELHREACERHWEFAINHWRFTHTQSPGVLPCEEGTGNDPQGTEALTCRRTAHQAASLLVAATWHPWVSAPYRWYQTRRLTRVLRTAMPRSAELNGNGQSSFPNREIDTIRATKTVANDNRAAQ